MNNIGNLFSVRDRTVVVTGGMGQLGRQFTSTLASNGARVALLDPAATPEECAARFQDWESIREGVYPIQADVTQRQSLERALSQIRSKWGTPDGLINNAAIDAPPDAPPEETGPFETYPETSWDQVSNVNSKGVFLACQVFGGAMAEAGYGSIINISSIYGLVSPDQRIYDFRRRDGETFFKPVAYSVTKAGLLNLTRYLATYWAPRGVRVNSLVFAGVFNNQPEEFLTAYCPKVPLGRMADETEYNGAVVFLLSDAASYMTGSTISVDGGFTAW